MILQNKTTDSKPYPRVAEGDPAKRQVSLIGHRYHITPTFARIIARENFRGEA